MSYPAAQYSQASIDLARKYRRDRDYVDMLHRKMMNAARIYDMATSAHASALRAYEQRYGSDR